LKLFHELKGEAAKFKISLNNEIFIVIHNTTKSSACSTRTRCCVRCALRLFWEDSAAWLQPTGFI